MTEWTMNTAQLEKGMMIRRPGLDESLEVVNVRQEQAKIKLPGGKTSTIPASAEVEWSWPETKAKARTIPEISSELETTLESITEQARKDRDPKQGRDTDTDSASDADWLTDWSLLDVGTKIEVLGEKGDFTILRLNDSSARIKHNATGQIQPLSIGHKFKIVEGAESAKPAKAKSSAKTKPKASKKPVPVPEPEPEPIDLPFDEPDQLPLDDDEPSDEVLAKIENGDDVEDEDLGAGGSDDDDSDLDLDDTGDTEDDDNTDNYLDKEDDDMPAPAPSRSTGARSTKRSTSGELLTVGQISERTGISYPTLMRYIKDHGDRLPSEGEGRKRRFLPEAIEVFREIRSETKGGRPSSGKSANPRKPRSDKGIKRAENADRSDRPTRPERSHETAAPYAAPARSQAKAAAQAVGTRSQLAPSSTIDQALVAAIEHAQAQIAGLQSLVDNLEAQREALKLWS